MLLLAGNDTGSDGQTRYRQPECSSKEYLMKIAMSILGVVLVFALGLTLQADEEKVPLDKLPKAVLDTVKAKFADAELVSASKEKEGDEVHYEVAIKVKGQNIEVTCKTDGTLVSIEKEIALKDLPKEVAEALEAKYPKATHSKFEEITKGDKITYEVLLTTADKKKLEVVFDPKGKVIEEEKKDKEDK